MVASADENSSRRLIEFLTANIRNKNTRRAYAEDVRQFCDWCDVRKITLQQVKSKPTVKRHLATIRMLCDYLVVGRSDSIDVSTLIGLNDRALIRAMVTPLGVSPLSSD